jgi:hypothetical protein
MGIKHEIGKCLRFPINVYKDLKAYKDLENISQKKSSHEKIKVGFIVYEPESWDKQQPLFEMMMVDERFEAYIVLCPSYDTDFGKNKSYGYEKDFFMNKYINVILAYEKNGKEIDLEKLKFDYLFYQVPYNHHFPKKMQSYNTVKYAKVCYIPYGYSISDQMSFLMIENKDFFRNVYFMFMVSPFVIEKFKKIYRRNLKKGTQHIEYLGYPALKTYLDFDKEYNKFNITWTPRWTYDKKIGGSHFFEYKDKFIGLLKKNNDINLTIRPHPMMFYNFQRLGIMTEEEINEYKDELKENNIYLDCGTPIDNVLRNTGILITDISSIIPSFFFTGRPIIYCSCDIELNDDLKNMSRSFYIAKSFEDIERHLKDILNGNDYLKDIRERLLTSDRYSIHRKSSELILDRIYKDFEE